MPADALIETLRREGIRDEAVLEAVRSVPRDAFVGPGCRGEAWGNHPLPIGLGQTISQPYIVALMTELLEVEPAMRVLEVGTGSGYQTAILVELGAEVYTIERLPALARAAARVLDRLNLRPADLRPGDGYAGWEEQAPFHRIIVTAAPVRVPGALIEQLAPGGRMVVPVGPASAQVLRLITRAADGEIGSQDVVPVRFVPLVPSDE